MNINNEAHSHYYLSKTFKKKKQTKNNLSQSNLEHVVKYSTYDSKDGIKIEFSHTKLVFAV